MWKSLRRYLRYLWLRRRIEAGLSNGSRDVWTLIERVIHDANRVFNGVVGPAASMRLETDLIYTFADQVPDADDVFLAHLNDSSVMICAYSIVGLQYMHSPRIADIPASVIARTEVVRVHSGCIAIEQTLGVFARGTVDWYNKSVAENQARESQRS